MALQQQIAEADHGGQQVVEVVGNAAGQLSHGLHFLRLGKLHFQIFAGSSVNHINDAAVYFGQGRGVAPAQRADVHHGDAFAAAAEV